MQTREEFIDAHWEEALVIDAKMREAAVACVKNFLGEDQEVESLLSKEKWLEYDVPCDYFMYLGYCCALKCLGIRFLRAREATEFLFLEVILQCSLGSAGVIVTIRDDFNGFQFSNAFKRSQPAGPGRLQVGQEMLKSYVSALSELPKSQIELQTGRSGVIRYLLPKLVTTLFKWKRSEEKKVEAREKEAEGIQVRLPR